MAAKLLNYDKFAKVVALADSDTPGEARAALAAVRRMLAEAGLCFRDIAEMTRRAAAGAGGADLALELQIKGLAQRLREREDEIGRLRHEIATWRDLAWSNTEELTGSNERLTVEIKALRRRLAAAASRPRRNAEKRAAVLRFLEDADAARLSDREIARRAGVSPQTVCNWRKRLARTAPASGERFFLRGGKPCRMRTGNIGQRRPPAAQRKPAPPAAAHGRVSTA